jgi:hypothetical protein
MIVLILQQGNTTLLIIRCVHSSCRRWWAEESKSTEALIIATILIMCRTVTSDHPLRHILQTSNSRWFRSVIALASQRIRIFRRPLLKLLAAHGPFDTSITPFRSQWWFSPMIWSLARHPRSSPIELMAPPAVQDDSVTFCQNTISSPLLLSSKAPALAV